MKSWLQQQKLSYERLSSILRQSKGNISNKVNGITSWQQKDLILLHEHYGLSADFVLGLSTTSRSEKEDNLSSRY